MKIKIIKPIEMATLEVYADRAALMEQADRAGKSALHLIEQAVTAKMEREYVPARPYHIITISASPKLHADIQAVTKGRRMSAFFRQLALGALGKFPPIPKDLEKIEMEAPVSLINRIESSASMAEMPIWLYVQKALDEYEDSPAREGE